VRSRCNSPERARPAPRPGPSSHCAAPRDAIAQGEAASRAGRSHRPGARCVHSARALRRKAAVESALNTWTSARLAAAMRSLPKLRSRCAVSPRLRIRCAARAAVARGERATQGMILSGVTSAHHRADACTQVYRVLLGYVRVSPQPGDGSRHCQPWRAEHAEAAAHVGWPDLGWAPSRNAC